MGNWTLTSGATTQSFAAWKIANAVRTKRMFAKDALTFTAVGRAIDADTIVAQWSMVSVTDTNGNPWYTGIVTKIPVKGSAKAEDQMYEVSGPWWYFETLVFQMAWQIYNSESASLVSTLRTAVIIGQSSDYTLISLAQVATTVLQYVLSMAAANADPLINGGEPFVPFTIGSMPPTATIPYTDVANRTCAQLMIDLFQWVPDILVEFDYTTTPPTLNFTRRSLAAPVTLAAYNGIVTDVDLTPLADEVPPAVIVKYIQPNTIDGVVYTDIIPDIYPVGAPDPAFRNVVFEAHLDGAREAFLKQSLTTTDRPRDYNAASGTGALSEVTLAWLSGDNRYRGLRQYTIPAGADPNSINGACPGNPTNADVVVNVDQSQMTVLSVVTNLVSNYTNPANASLTPPVATNVLVLPTGNVPAGGGPGTATSGGNALDYLVEELLEGSVPLWLTQNQNVYSARVIIAITVKYTGSDPVVKAMFGTNGVQTFYCPTNVTNGSTQTYQQLSSSAPPEPVPVGLAQYLYEGLSVLHFQGQVTTVEQECSGTVGMLNTLNLSGGREEWTTMIAQVKEIEEHLDTGTTVIKIGPPAMLSAAQLVDILHAAWVRQQSTATQSRQDGTATSNQPPIDGTGSTASTGIVTQHNNLPLCPFGAVFQTLAGGQSQIMIPGGTLQETAVLNDLATISNLATWMNWTPGNDFMWLEITLDGSNNITAAAFKNWTNGGTWVLGDLPSAYGDGHGPYEFQLTYDANGNSIYTQYIVRIPVYSSVTELSGAITNTQLLQQNLKMIGENYSGAASGDLNGPITAGIVTAVGIFAPPLAPS